jgi:hypothetical protein
MVTYLPGNQPCFWWGTNQINSAPWYWQKPTLQFNGNNIINHKQMTTQDVNESIGWSDASVNISGFLKSDQTDTTATTAMYPFIQGQYFGRPIAIGWLSADPVNPLPFFSSVGYSTNLQFDDNSQGRSEVKTAFNFGFIGTTYSLYTATDSGAHTTFVFSPGSSAGNGWFAGVMLSGNTASSGGLSMSSIIYDENAAQQVGTGPSLSFFSTFSSGLPFPNSSSIILPLIDSFSNQSIQNTNPGHDFYVEFANPFSTPVPTVQIVYIKA